jgi:hypothetical protein
MAIFVVMSKAEEHMAASTMMKISKENRAIMASKSVLNIVAQ